MAGRGTKQIRMGRVEQLKNNMERYASAVKDIMKDDEPYERGYKEGFQRAMDLLIEDFPELKVQAEIDFTQKIKEAREMEKEGQEL